MFLSNLDFLSSPPQMYFLKKRTNQTIFGGILFIIYIFIMMNIFVVYTLNFYLNDRYDIRYSLYKNFTGNAEEINQKEELNFHLNFSFDLKRISNELLLADLNDHFILVDNKGSTIERNTIISRSPSDMNFNIIYSCIFNCSSDEDNNTDFAYILNISYSGYKIDHQNDNTPLEKNNDKYQFYKEIYFSFSKSILFNINWGIIKYKEEKGILGLFNNFFNQRIEYTSIDIDSIDQTSIERILDIPDFQFKILCIINMNNEHNQYIEYKRLKKSMLDVFANIGALFSTIFNVFNFIYSFYIRNFNNYKIVKEILSVPKKEALNTNINLLRSKTIKFENISTKNKYIINNDNQSFNTSKSVPFKSKGINIIKKTKFKMMKILIIITII